MGRRGCHSDAACRCVVGEVVAYANRAVLTGIWLSAVSTMGTCRCAVILPARSPIYGTMQTWDERGNHYAPSLSTIRVATSTAIRFSAEPR
jgi:hypothetical protein